MVQVIENRTDIEGVVASRSPDPDRPEYDLVGVDVRTATAVDGYADVLSTHAGGRLDVSVPRALLTDDAGEGTSIRVRARLAGPGIVLADADPATLSLTPPV